MSTGAPPGTTGGNVVAVVVEGAELDLVPEAEGVDEEWMWRATTTVTRVVAPITTSTATTTDRTLSTRSRRRLDRARVAAR